MSEDNGAGGGPPGKSYRPEVVAAVGAADVPATNSHIAERLGKPRYTVERATRLLTKRGLLQRTRIRGRRGEPYEHTLSPIPDPEEVEEVPGRGATMERVYWLLLQAPQPLTSRPVAAALNERVQSAGNALRRAWKRGLLLRRETEGKAYEYAAVAPAAVVADETTLAAYSDGGGD